MNCVPSWKRFRVKVSICSIRIFVCWLMKFELWSLSSDKYKWSSSKALWINAFVRAAFKYPSSQVQTRPKPSGFFGAKKSSARRPSEGKQNRGSHVADFAACNRSLNWRGSRNFRQNYWLIIAHIVPPFATRISCIVVDVGVCGGECGDVQTGGGG